MHTGGESMTGGTAIRTDTLEMLIAALCSDYTRRENEILSGRLSRRADIELRYLNYKLFDAAAEIVGEKLSETYIREIGMRIGYAHSSVEGIGETTYKSNKSKIKEVMALKLNLK